MFFSAFFPVPSFFMPFIFLRRSIGSIYFSLTTLRQVDLRLLSFTALSVVMVGLFL